MEPPLPPVPPAPAGAGATSLSARMINVFAAPGDVFDEVKRGPASVANWLAPTLLAALVGVASVQVIFSQGTVLHQMREAKEQALEKQLRNVPKEKAQQAREMAEKFTGPTMLKIFGSVGATIGSFGWLFVVALIVRLIGRFALKANLSYPQSLEVCGLASMINVLGGIVATLLIVAMGNLFATAGPALLIREFDPANKTHLLVAAVNVMTFWYIGVLAVGLAKLSGVSAAKAALWLFGLWVVFRGGLILAGLGGQGF